MVLASFRSAVGWEITIGLLLNVGSNCVAVVVGLVVWFSIMIRRGLCMFIMMFKLIWWVSWWMLDSVTFVGRFGVGLMIVVIGAAVC